MSESSASVEVSVGRKGAAGDRLVARQEADRLVLEKPEHIKQRLTARFAQVPLDRRLVDELIDQTPAVIAAVQAQLPADFPQTVAEVVFTGLETSAIQLQRQLI